MGTRSVYVEAKEVRPGGQARSRTTGLAAVASFVQVARELGIEEKVLRRWKLEDDGAADQALGGTGKPQR
jgi:hypothetical protein